MSKESDLDRELRYHLESLADGFERQGMTRADAMVRARREFGGVENTKEQCRDERRFGQAFAHLAQDLSFGLRMLRKTPAVTAAAVLSLALGIGATTAIVALVDAVLWRTVGVPHPEQLTEILWQSQKRPEHIYRSSSGSMYPEGALRAADFFSRAGFGQMRTQAAGRAEVAAHLGDDHVSASYAGSSAVAQLRPVSANFFLMLQLRPALGRLLGEADANAGAPLAVIVSHSFWQSMLRADAQAIGQVLQINNHSYTIAGVLPRDFYGIKAGERVDLYTTVTQSPGMLDPEDWLSKNGSNPTTWYFQLLARREPGVTNANLQPLLNAAFRSSWVGQPNSPESTPSIRLREAATGLGSLRRDLGSPLTLLFALVALVLLIACANIANLLLARADSRRKEVALRVSLGCSRARLIRQFLTESALLAALGGLLSLTVAYATANFAVSLMPGELRLSFGLDARMLLATLTVTVFTALAFGLYPAFRATRVDAAPALKEGAGSIGGTRHHTWLAPGKMLVLGQVALGVLLVASAATFNAHLRKIISNETGFERTRLLMFDLHPGQSGYRDARLKQFNFDLEERLRRLPGVEAVGLARIRPMKGGGYWDDVNTAGVKPIGSALQFVNAGYLGALGVSIIGGRGISDQDVRAGAAVVVVSEDLAKAMGGGSPVGRMIHFEDKKLLQVIGVAARARYHRLTDQPNVTYLPNSLTYDTQTILLRTAVPPTRVLGAVRQAVRELDANLPMVAVRTMEEQIAETLRRERLFAWLCGAFGVLALILCAIGLYGVMSYATARRTQEIGIRMALGATPRDVLRHIIGEGMGVTLAGLLVGVPIAWYAAQKYVDYQRLGMEPIGAPMLIYATATLAVAAFLAVLTPALRAAASDPVKALREG